jgi:hypothetical protein
VSEEALPTRSSSFCWTTAYEEEEAAAALAPPRATNMPTTSIANTVQTTKASYWRDLPCPNSVPHVEHLTGSTRWSRPHRSQSTRYLQHHLQRTMLSAARFVWRVGKGIRAAARLAECNFRRVKYGLRVPDASKQCSA